MLFQNQRRRRKKSSARFDAPRRPCSRRRLETLEERTMLNIDMGTAGSKLKHTLDTVQSSVSNAFDSFHSIPFVGDKLDNSIGGLNSLIQQVDRVGTALATLSTPGGQPVGDALDALIQSAIQNSVSPFLGNTLSVTHSGSSEDVHVLLRQNLIADNNNYDHPQFDLGLGKLINFESFGVNVALGFQYDLTFHIADGSGAITLDSNGTPLTVTVDVTLPNSFGGNLPLLGFSAHNEGSRFTANFGVGLDSFGNKTSFTLSGDAIVKLGLTLQLDPTNQLPINPKFTSDFNLVWHFGSDVPGAGKLTTLSFDNVQIDVGALFPGFIQDIIGDVQHFTRPFQPFVNATKTKIPGLDNIGIDVSIRDLLDRAGVTSGTLGTALDAIDLIDSLQIPNPGSTTILLGSFSLLKGNSPLNDVQNGTFANDMIAGADVPPEQTILNNANNDSGGFFATVGSDSPSGLQFPILDNPTGSAFKLFLGQPADLFTYTMSPISTDLSGAVSVGVPLLASVSLSAGIHAEAHLKVGYDTAGIQHFLESGPDHLQLAALRRGFYVDSTQTGIDINGFMDAGLHVLLVNVTGGVYANGSIHLNPALHAPGDAKVRLDSLWNTITTNPLNLFAANGDIHVSLDVNVGIDTPFGDITMYSYNIGTVVLYNFNTSGNGSPPGSDSAAPDPNTIYIHMTSGDDHIVVQDYHTDYNSFEDPTTDYGVEVIYPDHIEKFRTGIWRQSNGLKQSNYPNLNLIAMDGPAGGNDSVNIVTADSDGGYSGEGSNPLHAILTGGDGNDHLEYHAGGQSVLVGGGGNDILVGGTIECGGGIGLVAQSLIFGLGWVPIFAFFGDTFNDTASQSDALYATDATNYMFGGAGFNTFHGSGHAVSEYGGPGSDLFILAGAESIFGGGGIDTMHYAVGDDMPFLQGTGTGPSPIVTLAAAPNDFDQRDTHHALLIGGSVVARDITYFSTGAQSDFRIRDLSDTSLRAIGIDDTGHATLVSNGTITTYSNRVTIAGTAGRDYITEDVHPEPYRQPTLTEVRVGGLYVEICGLASSDTVVLDGHGGGDNFEVDLSSKALAATIVTDSGPASNDVLTINGASYLPGRVDLSDTPFDLTQAFFAFVDPSNGAIVQSNTVYMASNVTNLTVYVPTITLLDRFFGINGNTVNVNRPEGVTTIYASNGDNTFNVTGPGAYSVYGGDGNDTFNVTGASNFYLEGGNGDDTFNASNNSGVNSIYGDVGNDVFNITGSNDPFSVGAGYHLDGGDGSDAYNLVLGGPIGISDSGSYGADTLVIDDSQNSAILGTEYHLSYNFLSRTDDDFFFTIGASVSFSRMATVTVDTNTNPGVADAIYVESTLGGTATTINEGSGIDSLNVQRTTGPLTINGGTGPDAVIAGANMDRIAGALTVNGGANTSLTVDDRGTPFVQVAIYGIDRYTLAGGALTRQDIETIPGVGTSVASGASIAYNGLASLTLDDALYPAISQNSVLNTAGTARVIVNASLGALVSVGSSSRGLDDIGNVTVNGGGAAFLEINDVAGTGLPADLPPDATNVQSSIAYTVTSTDITRNSGYGYSIAGGGGGGGGASLADISYDGISQLQLYGSNIGAPFTITGTAVPTFVNCGSGDDTVDIEHLNNLYPSPNNLSVTGDGGTNSLVLGVDGQSTVELTSSPPFTFADYTTVTKTGLGTLTIDVLNDFAPGSVLIANAGVLNLNGDVAHGASVATITVHAFAPVNFRDTQHLRALDIGANTVVTLKRLPDYQQQTLVTSSLSMTATSDLDLKDNAMILHGFDYAMSTFLRVEASIANAFDNANLDGHGIKSSSIQDPFATGLGSALNSLLADTFQALSTLNGERVFGNDIVVKYTYMGDATLDGVVNDDDVSLLGGFYDSGTSSGHHWFEGDFTHDGLINDDDVSVLSGNYNPGATPLAPAAEPAMVGPANGPGAIANSSDRASAVAFADWGNQDSPSSRDASRMASYAAFDPSIEAAVDDSLLDLLAKRAVG